VPIALGKKRGRKKWRPVANSPGQASTTPLKGERKIAEVSSRIQSRKRMIVVVRLDDDRKKRAFLVTATRKLLPKREKQKETQKKAKEKKRSKSFPK